MPPGTSPFNTPGTHSNLDMAPCGQEQLKADALALQLLKKDVENLIGLLSPGDMTADCLNVHNGKLKEIQDKFCGFSRKLSIFCDKYVSVVQMP